MPDEALQLTKTRGVRLPNDYRATMLAYPFPPDQEATAFDLWAFR
jgi:hypothetical protein